MQSAPGRLPASAATSAAFWLARLMPSEELNASANSMMPVTMSISTGSTMANSRSAAPLTTERAARRPARPPGEPSRDRLGRWPRGRRAWVGSWSWAWPIFTRRGPSGIWAERPMVQVPGGQRPPSSAPDRTRPPRLCRFDAPECTGTRIIAGSPLEGSWVTHHLQGLDARAPASSPGSGSVRDGWLPPARSVRATPSPCRAASPASAPMGRAVTATSVPSPLRRHHRTGMPPRVLDDLPTVRLGSNHEGPGCP